MAKDKKYSSVGSILFSIEHSDKEPTPREVYKGLLNRINKLYSEAIENENNNDHFLNEVVEVSDTVDLEELDRKQ